MDKILLKAPAKINLTLDILSKRPDGYHEIQTIMAAVGLYDTLLIEKIGAGIELSCPDWLPGGPKNLAFRAAEVFFRETGTDSGVKITLEKGIPSEAGLGGGSSDAAAVINGLDVLFETGLKPAERIGIGSKIGADVAFFISGGVALCEGIGEKITPLKKLDEGLVLICKPAAGLSTAEVYALYDEMDCKKGPDTGAMLEAIEGGDLSRVAASLGNALQEAACFAVPEISEIISAMLKNGALGAMMSGSGTAVFGLFDQNDRAEACMLQLSKRHSQVFLANWAK